MAWIHDDDLAAVRDRADIVDVVSDHVTLKRAGSDMMKGLCPLHDEKTPSFTVKPSAGVYRCHGCGQGGDVIRFMMDVELLTFTEAVETLADRYGITLRKVDPPGGANPKGGKPSGEVRDSSGPRARRLVLDALAAAEKFYVAQLGTADAKPGQDTLTARGFTPEHATRFGVGWAPTDRAGLVTHLTGLGHHEETLHAAGLTRKVNGRAADFFTGRLMWPIRDHSGRTVGFGARKVLDDDPIPAKYVNSPETDVFKKSKLLYGLDLARKQVAATGTVLVVEGYTDVMACHIAGVDTAVATCGTAFGEEHAELLHRFLGSDSTGAVFCFDTDEAGRKAAARAFSHEEKLGVPMWAAAAPDGKDPCEAWQDGGEAAIRAMVEGRSPLWRFVLGPLVESFDMSTPTGRVNALQAAADLLSGVSDRILRDEYARAISGLVGVSPDDAVQALTRASKERRTARQRDEARARARAEREAQNPTQGQPAGQAVDPFALPSTGPGAGDVQTGGPAAQADADVAPRSGGGGPVPVPDPHAPVFAAERETLKAALAYPAGARLILDLNLTDAFSHPWYQAAHHSLSSIRYRGDMRDWIGQVLEFTPTREVRDLIVALTVEPAHLTEPLTDKVAYLFVARLRELQVAGLVDSLRVRMGRVDQDKDPDTYRELMVKLFEWEKHRRQWAELATGHVYPDFLRQQTGQEQPAPEQQHTPV